VSGARRIGPVARTGLSDRAFGTRGGAEGTERARGLRWTFLVAYQRRNADFEWRFRGKGRIAPWGRSDLSAGLLKILGLWMERDGAPVRTARLGERFPARSGCCPRAPRETDRGAAICMCRSLDALRSLGMTGVCGTTPARRRVARPFRIPASLLLPFQQSKPDAPPGRHESRWHNKRRQKWTNFCSRPSSFRRCVHASFHAPRCRPQLPPRRVYG
jgi:hypothetical protein